jgi:hypothetical protein
MERHTSALVRNSGDEREVAAEAGVIPVGATDDSDVTFDAAGL